MSEEMISLLLYVSAIGAGLNAGLFFIFSNTVMSALGKLKPHEGILAMQSINRVILNPIFFLVFFGTALTSLALIILSFIIPFENLERAPVIIGSLCYLVGSILVTMIFNVPRNEALDKVDATTTEASQLWSKYLKEWTAWNHVRTWACALAMLFFIRALS